MSATSLGFGIVGLGMIAEFHAAALSAMDGGRLAACASASPGKADAFAKKHGGRAYASLAELLKDPAVDIVAICTPSGAHLEPALAAIEAGRHLVVEKPLEEREIVSADSRVHRRHVHGELRVCQYLVEQRSRQGRLDHQGQ